jgi:hypothetical protein
MKRILFLFLFILASVVYSQQVVIEGIVKDSLTNEPIISASIGVKGSPIGTITNDDGVFQLKVDKTSKICFSYLGYKFKTVDVSSFETKQNIILLSENEEVLEEVIIYKVPLNELLQDVINTSKAKFNKPIILNTYYREFVKNNNKYTKFSDGLLDYHLSGTIKKTKSDLIVKQNRSHSLLDENEQDEDMSFSLLDVGKGVSTSYEFKGLERVLLDDDNFENYDLVLKSKKDKSGNELFQLNFTPKNDVQKLLYIGSVTFDPKSKLIYDIKFSISENHYQFTNVTNVLLFKVSVLDSKFHASYKVVNSNYVLSFNNKYAKIKVWNKKRNDIMESYSDLIVTNFIKEEMNYSKKDIYTKNRLYDKPSNYKENFWLNNNAIVLTNEEEKIIASLENASKK